MTSIISGLLIASMLFLQGIGGTAGIGGKAGIGGSVPAPPPSFGTSCFQAVNTVLTINCTLTGVSTGDFIAAAFLWYAVDSPSGVTDSAGTLTPALASTPVTWDGGTRNVALYCEANSAGGNHTITITFASTFRLIAMGVSTFHGASTSACVQGGGGSLDGAPTSNVIALNANPFFCNAITTTQANDTIFAWGGVTLSVASAGSGYTGRGTINTNYTVEDGIATLPGSYAAPFATTATNHPAMCLSMAIKHV